MKIEKINANQIRCTLTREDLESRDIKLSELAYGNAKARSLFSEMMKQAYQKYGFDVSGEPVMVEAVPVSSDALVLTITRVDSRKSLIPALHDSLSTRRLCSANPTEIRILGPARVPAIS